MSYPFILIYPYRKKFHISMKIKIWEPPMLFNYLAINILKITFKYGH